MRIFFWSILISIFALGIYFSLEIIFPFFMAIIISYMINPLIEKFAFLKKHRMFAAFFLVMAFFAFLSMTFMFLVPKIYDQFHSLMQMIPQYKQHVKDAIIPNFVAQLGFEDDEIKPKLKEFFSSFSNGSFKIAADFLQGIWRSGMAIINVISLFLITPIISFYILRDFPRITNFLKKMLPKQNMNEILQQISLIDHKLSAYIRGQSLVCLLVGAYYCIMLSILGLNFSLFIGITAGLICFIPYVGLVFSVSAALVVAILQFDDVKKIYMVMMVFVVGHVVESFILTPKIIGDRIGIHAVWLLFGTFLGGNLLGFSGMLLAVPVMTILSVLISFCLKKYFHSNFYLNSNLKNVGK